MIPYKLTIPLSDVNLNQINKLLLNVIYGTGRKTITITPKLGMSTKVMIWVVRSFGISKWHKTKFENFMNILDLQGAFYSFMNESRAITFLSFHVYGYC